MSAYRPSFDFVMWVITLALCAGMAGLFFGARAASIPGECAHKEVQERCCSCTQTELGRCGR